MKYDNYFCEMSNDEMLEVDGGVVGPVCAVIGTVLAFYTFVYGVGYAMGQNAGYKEKYGK